MLFLKRIAFLLMPRHCCGCCRSIALSFRRLSLKLPMRLCFFCLILMFAMAELFHWLKHFSLPLPIYILGGAFLAIASNYDKRAGWPFLQQSNFSVEPLQPPSASPPGSPATIDTTAVPSQSDREVAVHSQMPFTRHYSETTASPTARSTRISS